MHCKGAWDCVIDERNDAVSLHSRLYGMNGTDCAMSSDTARCENEKAFKNEIVLPDQVTSTCIPATLVH